MNYELKKCYDVLGLSPGASPEQLKLAYRDLAKVWHPDRFVHDPRLQAKAQEKLKEINEAYEQFRSRPTSERHTTPPRTHYDRHAQTQTGSVAMVRRTPWRLMLVSLLIIAAVFLVTSPSLLRPAEKNYQSHVPAIEQVSAQPDYEGQQPGTSVKAPADELRRRRDRLEAKPHREKPVGSAASVSSATLLRPLPTVTVVIDPYSGKIARPTCPMKTTMTYPSGNEPRQYCALHPEATTAPSDFNAPKGSRLKSDAKRMASPDKWF
ncbi:MAG: J domain-containing protein [Pyrinomonadaceae bacterium]